jgi:hypothetical protein
VGTYRKKPVEVQAWLAGQLIFAAANAWDSLPEAIRSGCEAGEIQFRAEGMDIKTLEGTMTAELGDYVILGVAGELYPCKPGIFFRTYDAVSGSAYHLEPSP